MFAFTRVELFDQWRHCVGDGVCRYQEVIPQVPSRGWGEKTWQKSGNSYSKMQVAKIRLNLTFCGNKMFLFWGIVMLKLSLKIHFQQHVLVWIMVDSTQWSWNFQLEEEEENHVWLDADLMMMQYFLHKWVILWTIYSQQGGVYPLRLSSDSVLTD